MYIERKFLKILFLYCYRSKAKARTLERRVLEQGLPPQPDAEVAAAIPLPPAKQLPATPPQQQQHQFSHPQPSQQPATAPAVAVQPTVAPTLSRTQILSAADPIAPQSSTSAAPPVTALPIPRTTAWRKRAAAAKSTEGKKGKKPKRKYERSTTFNMCGYCRLPKTKEFGHSRHVGDSGTDTYCPSVEGKDGKTVQNPKTKN